MLKTELEALEKKHRTERDLAREDAQAARQARADMAEQLRDVRRELAAEIERRAYAEGALAMLDHKNAVATHRAITENVAMRPEQHARANLDVAKHNDPDARGRISLTPLLPKFRLPPKPMVYRDAEKGSPDRDIGVGWTNDLQLVSGSRPASDLYGFDR